MEDNSICIFHHCTYPAQRICVQQLYLLVKSDNTTNIFGAPDNCIVGIYKLNWANCKGIPNYGAANMTGINSGVVKRISEAAGNNVVWNHCFIHREDWASKGVSPDLMAI
ncbi:unnamed protein product [Lepeophtheirus salmonis]|uniref:(salmon louse) hypothetical protein n=1 Tax=Lepeophtheirus salmonis TaxID=72036 RepID=A0A7R8H5K0_LEPSM|nr:unnamed protein product [Lepeophtheirus salmonis]CAF2877734.1 unnamed protein product [Lepeophtheirus salmonis]